MTPLLEVIETIQRVVPLQLPDQPRKVAPGLGVGVRVTFVPLGNIALHVEPQEIPAGEDVTSPFPDFVTDKAKEGGCIVLNVPVTDLAVDMVMEQVPVPVQAPDQLLNTEPVAGEAVTETTVFAA